MGKISIVIQHNSGLVISGWATCIQIVGKKQKTNCSWNKWSSVCDDSHSILCRNAIFMFLTLRDWTQGWTWKPRFLAKLFKESTETLPSLSVLSSTNALTAPLTASVISCKSVTSSKTPCIDKVCQELITKRLATSMFLDDPYCSIKSPLY